MNNKDKEKCIIYKEENNSKNNYTTTKTITTKGKYIN